MTLVEEIERVLRPFALASADWGTYQVLADDVKVSAPVLYDGGDRVEIAHVSVGHFRAAAALLPKLSSLKEGGVPAGMKLVPVEPTAAMLNAGIAAGVNATPAPWCPAVWRAMLAAAPEQLTEPQGIEPAETCPECGQPQDPELDAASEGGCRSCQGNPPFDYQLDEPPPRIPAAPPARPKRYGGAGPWPDGQFYVWDYENASITNPVPGETTWRRLESMEDANRYAAILNKYNVSPPAQPATEPPAPAGDEAVERVARAIREAFQTYDIEGTSGHASGYGPPYRAPWHLIDVTKADPDVNWPGELVGRFDAGQAAWDAKWKILARAALSAMPADRNAVIEECAALCERVADEAERRNDVRMEYGATCCQTAIRALKEEG